MGACARNMQSDPAKIKPAQCCIKLVFSFDLYYDARKHKIKIYVRTITGHSQLHTELLLFLYTSRILSAVQVRQQICKKRLLASSCLSVCLSVRPSVGIEQLSSHWTDFHEVLYLSIFRKSVEKIQVSLKSDNNSGYYI